MTDKTLDEHAAAVERRNDVPLDRAYADILAAYEAERAARVRGDETRAALVERISHLVTKLQAVHGTPCAEIRWAEERQALEARVRELEAERDALAFMLRDERARKADRENAKTNELIMDRRLADAREAQAALAAALSTPGPTLAEIRRSEWHRILRLLSEAGLTAPGNVGESGPRFESGAQEAEDSSWQSLAIGARLDAFEARTRREAQVEVLREMTSRTLELGIHTTPFAVAEWLRQRADDLEAGRG